MNKISSCTDRAEKAKVYREAARIVDQGLYPELVGGWSCLAVARATDPEYTGRFESRSDRYKTVNAYVKVFPQIHGVSSEPNAIAIRVLALCFMAAMVEAGDA